MRPVNGQIRYDELTRVTRLGAMHHGATRWDQSIFRGRSFR